MASRGGALAGMAPMVVEDPRPTTIEGALPGCGGPIRPKPANRTSCAAHCGRCAGASLQPGDARRYASSADDGVIAAGPPKTVVRRADLGCRRRGHHARRSGPRARHGGHLERGLPCRRSGVVHDAGREIAVGGSTSHRPLASSAMIAGTAGQDPAAIRCPGMAARLDTRLQFRRVDREEPYVPIRATLRAESWRIT